MTKETEMKIRAAGLVQAVIASGCDPKEWERRSLYAARVHKWLYRKMLGKKPARPVPMKERTNG